MFQCKAMETMRNRWTSDTILLFGIHFAGFEISPGSNVPMIKPYRLSEGAHKNMLQNLVITVYLCSSLDTFTCVSKLGCFGLKRFLVAMHNTDQHRCS